MSLPSIFWDAFGPPRIMVFPGFSGQRTAENPAGMAKAWRDRGALALREFMIRGYDQGVLRFLVNRPGGAGSGPLSGAFWSVMSAERREQLTDLIVQMPGEVIAYVGSVIERHGSIEVSRQPERQLQVSSTILRDEWLRMIGCGFTSFAVDWAGRWPDEWAKTFDAAARLGITMYGEPAPFSHAEAARHRWISTLDYVRWWQRVYGELPAKPEDSEWIVWPLATAGAANEARADPSRMLEELAALKDGGWSLMYGAR